jgi:release factor glutamine methyltransferase
MSSASIFVSGEGLLIDMKIAQALQMGLQILVSHGIEDARRHAEWLLIDLLRENTAYLLVHNQEDLGGRIEAEYFDKIRSRSQGQPLQYLLGYEEFCGLKFEVTPEVLIPRPETEMLVAEALRRIDSTCATIADVGTGSGCIAVSMAKIRPMMNVYATDISANALVVARRNAIRLGVSNINFLQGDLMIPLESHLVPGQLDCVVSNPPYIADGDLEGLPPEVRDWEPRAALLAGPSGTAIFERLIPGAFFWLRQQGWFLAEIGYGIKEKVLALFHAQAGWRVEPILNDHNGIPRIVIAQKRIGTMA